MIVHFQNRSIHFKRENEVSFVNGALQMDFSNLQGCFERLTEGDRDITVEMGPEGLRRLLQYVKERYIFVKAAGGLVHDDKGRKLLMLRNERYDLPKGKVEPGETLAQAALRETNEETGLSGLSLGKLRLKTYHIYNLYGGWHFKQTTWYDMYHSGEQTMVPQQEEGISQVEWVDEELWRQRLMGSYSTMRYIAIKTTENK